MFGCGYVAVQDNIVACAATLGRSAAWRGTLAAAAGCEDGGMQLKLELLEAM